MEITEIYTSYICQVKMHQWLKEVIEYVIGNCLNGIAA
jgi:hypothetical protein